MSMMKRELERMQAVEEALAREWFKRAFGDLDEMEQELVRAKATKGLDDRELVIKALKGLQEGF